MKYKQRARKSTSYGPMRQELLAAREKLAKEKLEQEKVDQAKLTRDRKKAAPVPAEASSSDEEKSASDKSSSSSSSSSSEDSDSDSDQESGTISADEVSPEDSQILPVPTEVVSQFHLVSKTATELRIRYPNHEATTSALTEAKKRAEELKRAIADTEIRIHKRDQILKKAEKGLQILFDLGLEEEGVNGRPSVESQQGQQQREGAAELGQAESQVAAQSLASIFEHPLGGPAQTASAIVNTVKGFQHTEKKLKELREHLEKTSAFIKIIEAVQELAFVGVSAGAGGVGGVKRALETEQVAEETGTGVGEDEPKRKRVKVDG